jgi:hypothetical protein
MNADREAIERFVEAFETSRARWPGSLRALYWCLILCGILFAFISFVDIWRDRPIDPSLLFILLVLAVSHRAEKLSAEVLIPLAREHLRSTSSNRGAA